jgi:hypothetical protein
VTTLGRPEGEATCSCTRPHGPPAAEGLYGQTPCWRCAAILASVAIPPALLRPSPLTTGHLKTWACGIIYALGSVNFLFGKSQTPSMSAADLCAGFGVSKSTGSAKAKAVRDALDMRQMDPQWYRPSKMDENPMAWMIMVNGYVVDVRSMPRDIQEAAYAKGLIPYLPGDR